METIRTTLRSLIKYPTFLQILDFQSIDSNKNCFKKTITKSNEKDTDTHRSNKH